MDEIEQRLHEQFPETVDKTVEIIAVELELFEGEYEYTYAKRKASDEGYFDPDLVALDAVVKSVKSPKGYMFVVTTDNTLYLLKSN